MRPDAALSISRRHYPPSARITKRAVNSGDSVLTEGGSADMDPLPHDVKKAIELLRANCAQEPDRDALAAACGVGRRTLEKHFRRFLGRSPGEVRRGFCLEQARRELLQSAPGAAVTEIASRCGFKHLGRFATLYRARYGESPSD